MPPPPPFREPCPGQVELKLGGGGMALFGLPFFLAGLAITLAMLRGIPISGNGIALGGAYIVGLVIGAVFLAVGGFFLFGRSWVLIDKLRGRLVSSYGLLVPMRQKERMIDEFRGVLMAFQPGGAGEDSTDKYFVRLRAVVGADLTVCTVGNFPEARRRAEFLAQFLDFNLMDRTTDHELVVGPQHVTESLPQRLRSSPPLEVDRPATMRSEVEVDGSNRARIVVPAGGSFLKKTQRWVVTASRDGILVEADRQNPVMIPAADVLALDYSDMNSLLDSVPQASRASARQRSLALAFMHKLAPTQGITIKSRQGLSVFGQGLDEEEMRYLVSLIERAL